MLRMEFCRGIEHGSACPASRLTEFIYERFEDGLKNLAISSPGSGAKVATSNSDVLNTFFVSQGGVSMYG